VSLVEHAERGVPSTGQLTRCRYDPLEDRFQLEIRDERAPDVQERSQSLLAVAWNDVPAHPSIIVAPSLKPVNRELGAGTFLRAVRPGEESAQVK